MDGANRCRITICVLHNYGTIRFAIKNGRKIHSAELVPGDFVRFCFAYNNDKFLIAGISIFSGCPVINYIEAFFQQFYPFCNNEKQGNLWIADKGVYRYNSHTLQADTHCNTANGFRIIQSMRCIQMWMALFG